MPARTRVLSLVLVGMLLGACTAAGSPSPETSTAASAEPSPGEEPPFSEPGEPSQAPCDTGFVCSGALEPGEYTSTSTGATVTFTLAGEGWQGVEDISGDGFAIFNDAVGGQHGISVVAYYGEVFSDVCSRDATEMIGTTADDFIAFLATVEGIHRGAPLNLQIGGQPTTGMDLTTESPCNDTNFGDRMWLWTLPTSGDFHFNDAEQVRVYAVDAGNAVVAIVIEAFPDADYDVLLQKAEEVIATMEITPAS